MGMPELSPAFSAGARLRMRHLRSEGFRAPARDNYVQATAGNPAAGKLADRREPKTQRNNSILTTMSQPKYTCANCESEKEPYFSRSEPMGFYCADCGHNFDEVDPEDFKEIKKQLATERALADRLAKAVQNHFDVDGDMWATQAQLDNTSNRLESALAAWKEARSE